MSKHPELIVMLTHNDRTVENAYEIFDTCKDTRPNIGASRKSVFLWMR